MKTAVLVTFEVTTRVIIDVNNNTDEDFTDNEFENGVVKAREHILKEPENYLYGDNVIDFVEDDECPYGTLKFDE